MGDIVQKWYEDRKNVDEMRQWNDLRLKKWERSVAAMLPEKAAVLDIGCGTGREAFALADLGFSVVGVDISQKAVKQAAELAAENGSAVSFLHYDGHVLPFDDGSFDAVIIWAQTFGLLYGDERKDSFLRECWRVLKECGLISFSGHDHAYLAEAHPQCLNGRRFYPYTAAEIYWESFLPHELSGPAERAGFSVLLCERGEIYRPEDGFVLHCLARKSPLG